MNRWTGVLVAALSFVVVTACGGAEEVGAPEEVLGQHEGRIDVCGNGICYSYEQVSCPEDCTYGGYCGDGACTGPETYDSCSRDCPWTGGGCFAPSTGTPSEPLQGFDVCGNGICYYSERNTCPDDCYYGGYCGDGACAGPETVDTCDRDCAC
ncbi:hypothetical protein [Myxococcus sp. RHSTA-1-4]|uniref:hypothetical protein n=1 Tax=Myxococcus sp. RHSTA-1-4 TaxID=2874601 RepID=UPI001CC0C78F|nr:hypothetical protein [Myxococcus sp. RHSTA-1-4]MBZ4421059.1 hypothetical protein [Myxococcus sp. RHSTA-1-4]